MHVHAQSEVCCRWGAKCATQSAILTTHHCRQLQLFFGTQDNEHFGYYGSVLGASSMTKICRINVQCQERSWVSVAWTSLNNNMARESERMLWNWHFAITLLQKCFPEMCITRPSNRTHLEFVVLIVLCKGKCAEGADRLGNGDCKKSGIKNSDEI